MGEAERRDGQAASEEPMELNKKGGTGKGRHEGKEEIPVDLRWMTIEDIPGVMTVEHASFTMPWTQDAFRNELTQNHFAKYVVMIFEERIIGYAGMWTVIDEAHITNIAVHPDFRGHGLGERLLLELVVRAMALQMQKMTLEVRVSNQVAQRLYAKFGFTGCGIRKGYYSDNQEDALIMWTDLASND
ncbi:ribosomal protein S18-alanine N-acetyltransferase [Paenibacillus apiarius]|uniref:Ribosomal protein S18-alanine N-acetyltransferase n=2 Tax=Paenibacillus apiarius TaxID=46240 RepID=A0ABT4DUS7_9BACL|nr:ribosomal protein S18-alanine N-acetyltransferase [Paenibacillus apiarius]MCY9514355.1 ribosomal protein S18-alanine N-acetyltransferase [Paenibacillus apiarius]MCY9521107.1 ribosomal protein S18-alanine N-acetyltransferase [Paenibacillus apiarius]MCY9551954.1 ribosomal protein S18-alanine N-acetyltransferase [Paenibacillus apiarius]MCY9557841.1 ribosomal protein S18-alanine N-acetyltransferase [Paenibacillus apiarius]MCY9684528.1 ribosomal protein S18-alanine N-acetyltransferase [Paenibaci